MLRIVGLQETCLTRAVVVKKPAHPKAQRAGAQHVSPQVPFRSLKSAHGTVALHEGAHERLFKKTSVRINAPVVDRNGQIIEPGDGARKIKVENPRHAGGIGAVAGNERIVAKKIAVTG